MVMVFGHRPALKVICKDTESSVTKTRIIMIIEFFKLLKHIMHIYCGTDSPLCLIL